LAAEGGPTSFLARQFPKGEFLGVDKEPQLISFAEEKKDQVGIQNLSFQVGDIFNLGNIARAEGVLMIQTISWLPDYKEALTSVLKSLSPDWLFVTGLFYPGEIEAITLIKELRKERQVFYNTYSIPDVQRFGLEKSYLCKVFPFDIDIDIAKSTNIDKMSTFTITNVEDGKRYQISGPLLLNWHGILFEKIKSGG